MTLVSSTLFVSRTLRINNQYHKTFHKFACKVRLFIYRYCEYIAHDDDYYTTLHRLFRINCLVIRRHRSSTLYVNRRIYYADQIIHDNIRMRKNLHRSSVFLIESRPVAFRSSRNRARKLRQEKRESAWPLATRATSCAARCRTSARRSPRSEGKYPWKGGRRPLEM